MLQKNVLEYLEASASRVPDKVAFSDEAEAFTFAQLQSAAKSMGTALAQRSARKNAPVVVLVNHRAANLAACFGALYAGNFYVPLDSQMPLPRLRSILETLSPAALVYDEKEAETAQALAEYCPLLLDREGFACPEDLSLLAARRRGVLDIDPVYAKGSSSPTEASLTSSNGWRRPARSPGKTSWATRPPFTLTCR